MERERVKRMRGGRPGNDDDEDVPGASGPKGGFAARRAKVQAAAEGGEGDFEGNTAARCGQLNAKKWHQVTDQ